MPHKRTQKGGNLTSAFIDLATLDSLEQQLYGLEGVISYFSRTTTSCTWFTMVPCVLSRKKWKPNLRSRLVCIRLKSW